MFYSNQILARKGPLGLVWIAAHLDRQLKRQQINNTSIPASVDTLLDSEVPLALRLSGQLLLGVVRIYARKVNYLQQDCNDALSKIHTALNPADAVNLPAGSQMAPVESITLLAPGAQQQRGAKSKSKAGEAGSSAQAAARGIDAQGFIIGDDDFYWEQDVLLRDGGSGFDGFGLGGGLELGLAVPSGSGPASQDISGVFGMSSSQADYQEVFDVEDEEAAAVWDLDEVEVERLRAVASQGLSQRSSQGLSGLGGLTPGVDGPQGKGAVAAGSPADSDADALQPLGDMPDDIMAAETPGNAAAAAAVAAADELMQQTPAAVWDDAADVLPPTPAAPGTAGDSGEGGGYTGGTDGGYTPATGGGSLDVHALLPPTPDMSAEAAAAAEDGVQGGVHDDDPMRLDKEAMQQQQGEQQEQAEGDAGASQQEGTQAAGATKTFQRRNTRAQQKEQQQEVAQEPVLSQEEAAAAAAAAKKAARQKRMESLLGRKRQMQIDAGDPAAAAANAGSRGSRAAGVRLPPATELPGVEIRALLADRAPLLDKTRGEALGKRLKLESSGLLLQPSGPAAAALAAASAPQVLLHVQPQLALPVAGSSSSAAPAAGRSGRNSSRAAAAASAGIVSGLAALGPLAVGLGSGFTGGPGLGGLGLPLPAELQELFVEAAAQAGATAGHAGSAAAVAPTAALDEIGMVGEEEEAAGVYGGLNPARLAGGVTRTSLSLSLTSTPGSAAAAAGGGSSSAAAEQTPATGAAAADEQEGFLGTAGSGGFGSAGPAGCSSGGAGFDGYTPGSIGDVGRASEPGCDAADGGEGAAGVLQPLNPSEVMTNNTQDMDRDLSMHHAPEDADFPMEFHTAQEPGEGSDKENPAPPSGTKAAAAAGVGIGMGFIGSSACSTQEVVLPWPADAETLMEQPDGEDVQVADGGFTSRTRLVMKHLQHAAASAAAAAGGSNAPAATPASASRRRISAAPPPGLAAAAAAAGDKGGAAAAAAAGATALSFDGLVQGHSRLDACRWFYEVLVLGNKGLVEVQQDEAYGDIKVTPNLVAMARM